MLRIALIGAGNHCRGNHAPALAKYAMDHPGQLELTAVCDLQREKTEAFCETFGFKAAYTDYVEMIETEKPDGCVCVMPILHITNVAMDLLRRGMPATVEKPMGVTLDEVRKLTEVARETGTPNMVSVNRRFEPLTRQGIEWARSQGPLRYVRASILRHKRTEKNFVSGTAIHCMDTLRHVAGEIVDYRVRMHLGETPWFSIGFEFESGVLGTLDVFPTDGSLEERYELFGEGYRVDAQVGPSQEPRLRCWQSGEMVVDVQPPADEPEFVRVGAYGEAEEFIQALAEGRPPWPSIEEVFPSVEIAYTIDPSMP